MNKRKTGTGILAIKDDKSLVEVGDVLAAIGLLSRLPVRVNTDAAQARGAAAAWAYPVAGVVIAILVASITSMSLWFAIPAQITAGLALATLVIITGAMHEDGLADSLDGLWGGWDKVRRLEIMKDSRIGAYGVLALVISLGLRWSALTAIIAEGWHWAALIAVAATSRAAMVPVMAILPHARADGLSQRVGQPHAPTAWVALGIAAVASVVLLGSAAVSPLICAAAVAALWSLIAKAKIGGQTGDILGATQQFTEIAMLIAIAAMLA